MARQKMYEYEVTGHSPFPINMLCYDQAWPARREDVAQIEASVRHERGPYRVRVLAISPPTSFHWSSFAWLVDPATLSTSWLK